MKYKVTATVPITIATYVDARSPQEAKRIANAIGTELMPLYDGFSMGDFPTCLQLTDDGVQDVWF